MGFCQITRTSRALLLPDHSDSADIWTQQLQHGRLAPPHMAPCVPKQHTDTLVPHTNAHSHISKHIAVPAWPHGSMAEALSVDGEHGAARGAAAQRARSVAVRQHGSEQSGRAHQSRAWLAQEEPLGAPRALAAPRQRPSPASRHAVHVAPEHTTTSTSTAAVRQRVGRF